MGACASRFNEPKDEVTMPEAAPEPAPAPAPAPAVEAKVSTEAKIEEETKEQPLVDISETPIEPSSASDGLDELAPELKELKVDAPVEIKEEIVPKDEVALKEIKEEEEEEAKVVAVDNQPSMEENPMN